MKFCYADPPYIGQAARHYKCAEIDHRELVRKLDAEFDAWALSCSSPSLQEILSYCPKTVRIGAWVKPFAFFKGKGRPPYAWEPVIFKTPRKSEQRPKGVRDWLILNAWGVTKQERDAHGIKGAKRYEFSYWIFALLGMTPADDFTDMFHGSGMVKEAHEKWKREWPDSAPSHKEGR